MNATFPVTVRREYPSAPLVAVAAVVLDDAGRVLLVKRGRQPAKGLWGLPGGLLDLGEPLQQGVVREVWEETGIEIEIVEWIDFFEPIERDAAGRIRYHYVVIDFWARCRGGTLRPHDDAAAAAWVPVETLNSLAMEEATRRVVRKAYARWQNCRLDLKANTP